MIRHLTAVAALCLAASSSFAAQCITDRGQFGAYRQAFAADAQRAGIGSAGLQALGGAQLSGITWRFESQPSSQTGTSYSDPETFLNRRFNSVSSMVNQAQRRIRDNQAFFNSLEQAYGVPAEILVAIWGYETSWGGFTGDQPVVGAALTLASYCRRHPRFEPHAIAALSLVDQGAISANTRGGPSGELGHMQFLAGNWVRYGVDADRNGRADPYSVADALASAANMLRSNGWQPGQPYGQGTRNFQVLSVWNDSGNYQRAIVYAAEQIAR